MQIFVLYLRKTYTLDVEPSTTIGEIKEKLKNKIQLEYKMTHYELDYANRHLEDEYTLEYYKIKQEATLHFVIKNICRLSSTIKINFNDEILEMTFPCFCCNSILDYKKEIFKRRGYPIDCQLLYLDHLGKYLLKDDDYESNPALLKIDEKKIKKGYNVTYYNGIKGKNIISGCDIENIGEIKEKIMNKYELPRGVFELVYDYTTLNDNKKLSDYGIYYESNIKLVIEKKYEYLLFNEDFTEKYFLVYYKGKTFTAGIEDNTILGIKKYLSGTLFDSKIELNKMKITFMGIILDDNLNIEKEGLCTKKLELIVQN